MKETIGLDFFAKISYPSRLREKDGVLYFVGKHANMDKNSYDSDLYRLVDGKALPLTSSRDVSTYELMEDGIVFPSLRTDKDKEAVKNGEPLTVYQKLPYTGGEAQECLRLPYLVTDMQWLPGGKALFAGQYNHTLQGFLKEHGGDMEKALKAMKEQDESLTVLDELPFWFNGQGIVNKKRNALYFYDGKESRMLTDINTSVGKIVLDAAKRKAIFTLQTYEHNRPETDQLYCLDIESGKMKALPSPMPGSFDDYAFGPDGTVYFLFSALDAAYGLNTNPDLYSMEPGGGEIALLDNSGAYCYHNSVGSDAKLGGGHNGLTCIHGKICFISTQMHSSHMICYDLESKAFTQITQEEGLVSEWIPYEGGYAMIAMRGNGLSNLYAVAADGQETQLSRLNDALMDRYEVVTPLPLTFTNKQGTEIEGWVMPPVGYVPGMVYPAILNIHGGPKTVYGSVFFHEMQYWCAQGYAVLFCNPTGGDGRGNAFADIRGKYGTVDYDDIMQFVDEAVTRYGFISAVRMGVTGGSYGGFMTNWIIGHTDRFRAAASQRSISNWVQSHFAPQ